MSDTQNFKKSKVISGMRNLFNKPLKKKEIKAKVAQMKKEELATLKIINESSEGMSIEEFKSKKNFINFKSDSRNLKDNETILIPIKTNNEVLQNAVLVSDMATIKPTAKIDLVNTDDSEFDEVQFVGEGKISNSSLKESIQRTRQECTSIKKEEQTQRSLRNRRKSELISENTNDSLKPRIVLTFRTSGGCKSSSMKIISKEDKESENGGTRRSARLCQTNESNISDNEDSKSPGKESGQPKTEVKRMKGEMAQHTIMNTKRQKKSGTLDLVNAKPVGSLTTQRPLRRIKPTAKVLANRELKWLTKSSEVLVDEEKDQNQPRRTLRQRRLWNEYTLQYECEPPKKKQKHSQKSKNNNIHSQFDDKEREENRINRLKKKHMSKLGLRAVNSSLKSSNIVSSVSFDNLTDDSTVDSTNTDAIIEHINAQKNLMDSQRLDYTGEVKLVEKQLVSEAGDDASFNSDDVVENNNICQPNLGQTDNYNNIQDRLHKLDVEQNMNDGSEGNDNKITVESSDKFVNCLCESNSKLFVKLKDNNEVVYCGGVCSMNVGRVGCSRMVMLSQSHTHHDYKPIVRLVRPSTSAPYLAMCQSHRKQLKLHMCCPKCGLFCTQGLFYQCNRKHLFHLECMYSVKGYVGCPHCGNVSFKKVNVDITSSKKIVFLPEQRMECIQAYMSFKRSENSFKDKEQINLISKQLIPKLSISPDYLRAAVLAFDSHNKNVNDSLRKKLIEYIENKNKDVVSDERLLNMVLECYPSLNIDKNHEFFHMAAYHGNLKVFYMLHYIGADINMLDHNNCTPLTLAVQRCIDDNNINVESVLEVVRYACAAGAHVCTANSSTRERYNKNDGSTLLHIAAATGLTDMCKELTRAIDFQVDVRDGGGWTPLVWAAENKYPNTVKYLLSLGANPHSVDSSGHGVVHWTALAGDPTCMHLLLKASPTIHQVTNTHGDTALHIAARENNYACVVVLLAFGARCDLKNDVGENPLDCADIGCKTAIMINKELTALTNVKLNTIVNGDISNGHEIMPIQCVNGTDNALPPKFNYITENVYHEPIKIDNSINTMKGCWCHGACELNCSCVSVSVKRWLSYGRLVSTFPYSDPPMLFECNSTCTCNYKTCSNRSISKLLKTGATWCRVEVFRRNQQTGWGVRTIEHCQAGQPLLLYVGELLTSRVADTRSMDHYMFALTLHSTLLQQGEEEVCVDASMYGSVARFVNHSCDPNLAPVRVFTSHRDLRQPHIVLFAMRNILTGEELTFDYGDKFWSVKSKVMSCQCGSNICRYPTKTE